MKSSERSPVHDFKFKESELRHGFNLSCKNNLLGETMPSRPTPAQCRAEAIAQASHTGTLPRRRPRSFLNPAVNFMLEATLNVVTLRSVQERMAQIKEVKDRAEIAALCGTRLAIKAVESDVLIRQFGDDQIRVGALTEEVTEEELQQMDLLNDEKGRGYVLSLPGATIVDVAIVAGGALNVLHAAGIKGNEAHIIGRSPLLDTAGAAVANDVKKADALHAYLGMPYADPSRLALAETDDPTLPNVVTYTEETLAHIHSLYAKGRGCPAQGVLLASGLSLLDEGWRNVVDYLVPEGATTLATN